MIVGPDARRYLLASMGTPVPRPFHLRWLLPCMCGQNLRRWWIVWGASWPLLAAATFAWQHTAGWQIATASAALLLGLPGILGPKVVIPIGVDLPASALTLTGVALWQWSSPAAIAVIAVAACVKETSPIFAAVWLWSVWPLVALLPVVIAATVIRSGPDPLGPTFQRIADHPIRTALEAHRGRWRDAWLMLAPWGACVVALYAPTWQVVVVLVVAHAQLLVATDTVRLVHHAAGPVVAAAAAHTIPVPFLLLAVAVHLVWWRTPERI